MAMRGRPLRARSPITIDVRTFGWDRALVATLRHPTLPWFDEVARELNVDGIPLAQAGELGRRDRLSLLGQFAAHEAFLQFAGFADPEFEANEWMVVQKRGTDCRLIRIAARSHSDDAPPALSLIQQFASAVDAPSLRILRQPWARAEAVYEEVDVTCRRDAAADLRWLSAAALGEVSAPGAEALRMLLAQSRGRFRCVDHSCVASLRAAVEIGADAGRAVRLFVCGDGGSPLERYSAIAPLREIVGDLDALIEAAVVERIAERAAEQRLIFVTRNLNSFDPASRRVVELLEASDIGVWLVADGTELPETRWFVLSPRLMAARELQRRIESLPAERRRQWLEDFIASDSFPAYLREGDVPPAEIVSPTAALCEPLRSYIAAVALLGTRVHREVADQFLRQLLSGVMADDLVSNGLITLEGDVLAFASDAVRDDALRFIPAPSRASLHRLAADVLEASGDRLRAATLLLGTADTARGVALLERIEWQSAEEAIRALRAVPPKALSPSLARTLTQALVETGRYADAREIAAYLPDEWREPLLARIERRTGNYAAAFARLERLSARDFDAELLRADLLVLAGNYDAARDALDGCLPRTEDERVRLGYHRAVLANETGTEASDEWLSAVSPHRDYYAARIGTYRAVSTRDLDAAQQHAREALRHATTAAERINATLDVLFTLFTRGQWTDARSAALDALLLVDQTQGDRASGGILFLLAYLCADNGQFNFAAQLIDRLRHFYREMNDGRRLLEVELLAAHFDLSRGRFASAIAAAETVFAASMPEQMHEAAALILDEIDWIEGRTTPLRSMGATPNIELTDRHSLLAERRGVQARLIDNDFIRALLSWEREDGEPPSPSSGSERLMLFRAALGCGRRDLAVVMAAEMKITFDRPVESAIESELRILRIAATREFPFAGHDFGGIAWRFASRNRLGQWHEIGSLPALEGGELDRILDSGAADWIACSDHELLSIEGLDRWPVEAREAVAALFHARAEHHNLLRLAEQEERTRDISAEGVEGMVGQSPAMREVYVLVMRVARRDVPVCILGESGTGKELVARAIHRQSNRRHKSFTAVNCAALPENLVESELFGHARGAFTGADRDRVGLIEATDGGTLFLDEIGEMPLSAQAKLLRFLQEGELRRVGDTSSRSADVRVLTATNRKLEAAVEQGRFREDLYYRIRGVEIILAPLRDRTSDIPLLASHFLAEEREKHRGGPIRLSDEVEMVFASYHWPGNVRELQNTIRAAHAIAADAKVIALEHLPERLRKVKVIRAAVGSYQDAVTRFRRELIEKSLAQANGNQNRAAAMLKISRQALAYQIRELGILVTASKRPRL
jgi:DNA-binding NtrC family response regulator